MAFPVFRVLEPGFLTTIQDIGRFGYLKYGVPPSGIMDAFSFRIANLLVNNKVNQAVLEITGVGPTLESLNSTLVALTGADLYSNINGTPLPEWKSTKVTKGSVIHLGNAKRGFRAYLSIKGGIDVPKILGSRSTYLRGKIGGVEGRALAKGDIINSIVPTESLEKIRERYLPSKFFPVLNTPTEVRVLMGPQDDYFNSSGIETFLNSTYVVSAKSDRTGYRLKGPIISHKDKTEIISDAISKGAIQVPGNGLPIILMVDRPLTGGYPKIACVSSVDIDKIAQLKPEDKIKFKRIDIKEAHELLRAENEKLLKINNILNEQSKIPAKKRYRVIVEGETYEVTVEELPGE